MYPTPMNPNDPSVQKRHDQIKELLMGGMAITEVAKRVGLSRKRTYDLAKRANLPYNRTVFPGGSLERRIVELYASAFTIEEIGGIYRLSPIKVQKVLDWVRDRNRAIG